MSETIGQAFERAKGERDIAQAQVAAVSNLHFTADGKRCEEDGHDWPCLTQRAIDAAEAARRMALRAALTRDGLKCPVWLAAPDHMEPPPERSWVSTETVRENPRRPR